MIHFSLRQLMEHQQKKVKVNIFGYIFNLCDSVNLSPGKTTALSGNTLEGFRVEKQSASRVARRFSAPKVHLGPIKKIMKICV